MSSAKSNTSNEMISGSGKLKEAYHLAEEGTAELMNNVKDKAREHIEENKHRAKEFTENTKQRVHDVSDAAKLRASELSDRAESLIQERPLVSIGVAFLAGWAVSKLLK